MRIRFYSRHFNNRKAYSGYELINQDNVNDILYELRSIYNNYKPSTSSYSYGTLRVFKTRPTNLRGWKRLTDTGKTLQTQYTTEYDGSSGDGDINQYVKCYGFTTENRGSTYVWANVVDRYLSIYTKSNEYPYEYACNWKTIRNHYNWSSSLDFSVGSGYNIPAGYSVYVYEYVGGNYYYDEVNDIEYGSPSKEWLELCNAN